MGSTLFVLLFVSTGATAALKGRWLLFLAGLLLGPGIWALAFLLPAKPRSWWFANLYGDEKRLRAVELSERLTLFRRS
jgi:hypothetical protein